MLVQVNAVIWIGAIAVNVAIAFMGRDGGLAHLAFPLMTSAWMAGFLLLQFAGVVGSRSGWQTEAVEQDRRTRLRRWLTSPEPTYVDLSGNAKGRAAHTEEAKDAAGQPEITIVVMPLLTAIGAACFGFAGAMALAAAYLPPRTLGLYPPALNLYWGVGLAFVLWMSLRGVGRASLRVYRWTGERAAAAARARADMERARFAALQAQMNPHFLFNTLNTVAALAGPDSPRAERVVEHLSAVLRQSLQRANQPFTSLGDEVRFITEYLDVEQARLGTRLDVTWNINAQTLPMRVPTMCLLPLVENAIVHAIELRADGGHVQISSMFVAGGYLLRMSVEDDGPGFPPDMKDGTGLGGLRERLHAEYGRTHALDTETLPTGARATISLPARPFVVMPS
jgi:signal transduction histidine kinase